MRGVSRLDAKRRLGRKVLSEVYRKRKNIILTIGLCVVLHLFLSITSGLMVGYARNELIGDRSNIPENVIKSTDMTRQWLENNTHDAIRFWYPVYNWSQQYPVGWILTPISKKIGRYILKGDMDESNSSSQKVMFQVRVIAFVKTVINSFFFGFILFWGWYLAHKIRQKLCRA